MLIWASAFSNLLLLTANKKSLIQATVVYKRLPTLASMLTNYKKVACSTTENTGQGKSQPCKKCGLCGHFNHYKSMVSAVTSSFGAPVQTSIMGPHFLYKTFNWATFCSTGIIAFLWGFSTTSCYRNILIESFDILQHSKELQ